MMYTKKIMRDIDNKRFLEIYKIESEIQKKLSGTPDNIEGVKAFLEKRSPKFN